MPMLESLDGDIGMLRQLGRVDAAFEIIQAASDEAGEASAKLEAENAMKSAYANVEANFFDMWTAKMTRAMNRAARADSTEALGIADPFDWARNGSVEQDDHDTALHVLLDDQDVDGYGNSATVELVDGSTHGVTVAAGDDPSTNDRLRLFPWAKVPNVSANYSHADFEYCDDITSAYDFATREWSGAGALGGTGLIAQERDGAGSVRFLDARDYWDIHKKLIDQLNEELAHVETMVSNLYQPAVEGKVDFSKIASGSAMLEAAQDGELETWKEVAGVYRALWIPESEKPVVISLENGVELEGLLFWTEPSDTLQVGESINPSIIGRFYMAAEIRYVPPTPETSTATMTILVEDSEGNGIEGATIDVKGQDLSYTTDADGAADVDLSGDSATLYISDGGTTASETGITIGVEDGTTLAVTHDGSDRTSYEADPFDHSTLTPEDEGTALPVQLTEPFTLEGIDGGGSELDFVIPDRVEPDDDFDAYKGAVEDAADNEQETREETNEIIVESGGISFPGLGDVGGGGLLAGAAAVIGVGWLFGKASGGE
ncbi:carboxypeptidase-like regulatory domain-containing protein [Halovivax limisalsi]|uniref:carboxypeptidase-like regulatory domain-containing protein n=1 Tax=Halovivax limisalsi TaxID=1453760 RepID=UPI001FFD870F|nr:carboxypeptidase-like regulatory domain-containing protein [Halovivax limisalsi]